MYHDQEGMFLFFEGIPYTYSGHYIILRNLLIIHMIYIIGIQVKYLIENMNFNSAFSKHVRTLIEKYDFYIMQQ